MVQDSDTLSLCKAGNNGTLLVALVTGTERIQHACSWLSTASHHLHELVTYSSTSPKSSMVSVKEPVKKGSHTGDVLSLWRQHWQMKKEG